MPSSFQHNPELTVPASPAANSVAAWSAANNLSATIAMNSASISTIADGDIVLVYDASASGLATITKANLTDFTVHTAETSIASDDVILIYDTSASAFRKMTRANFTAGLSGLAANSADVMMESLMYT